MCRAHIVLQELQAVPLILHKMAIHFTNKVAAYIWTVVLLRLVYVIKVVELLFLSRLACHIFNLANRHGITRIPTYMPTHLNVEAEYLSQGQFVLECHWLPYIAEAAFHP